MQGEQEEAGVTGRPYVGLTMKESKMGKIEREGLGCCVAKKVQLGPWESLSQSQSSEETCI